MACALIKLFVSGGLEVQLARKPESSPASQSETSTENVGVTAAEQPAVGKRWPVVAIALAVAFTLLWIGLLLWSAWRLMELILSL